MAYKGFSGSVESVIANSRNQDAVNKITQGSLIETNSPLAEAQRQADLRSKLQQKRPMVFEYPFLHSYSKELMWKSVELYINPERIAMSGQKVKGKQFTRGGIFYHHWGDDHYQMQISGTTGLSGMKGIEQLEEIYHASGTILNYYYTGAPQKIQLNDVLPFEVIDFNDVEGALSTIKANIGSIKMEHIKKRLDDAVAAKVPKPVYWDGIRMYPGQVGRLKILKPIHVHPPGLKFDASQGHTWFLGFPAEKDKATVGVNYRVYGYAQRKDALGLTWRVDGNRLIRNVKGYVQYERMPEDLKKKLDAYTKALYEAQRLGRLNKDNQNKVLQSVVDMYLAGMYNIEMVDKISDVAAWLYEWQDNYKKNGKIVTNRQFFQNAFQLFGALPGLSSEIVVQLAYQHTLTTFGKVDEESLAEYYSITGVNIPENPLRIEPTLPPGTRLLPEQIGIIEIIKPVPLYKGAKGSNQLTFFREAKAGEKLPVFGYRSLNGGQYELADYGYVTDRPNYIKYVPKAPENDTPMIPDDDMGVQIAVMAQQRAEAIRRQIDALDLFYKNEASIRNQLKATADAYTNSSDKWLPRNVILYFENRAYVGHFDSFSYSRVANTPLINYELRFTIEKQIVGSIEKIK